MNKTLAPIVMFVYDREDHTEQTLQALKNAILADRSHLFIFADGAKNNASPVIKDSVSAVRNLIKSQKWCGEVTINESSVNKGLAKNIITGVTNIINRYGKIIVLEDDIVVGKHYLEYTNEALDIYENNKSVWEVTGFCDPLPLKNNNTVWFNPIEQCWSWATWANRWQYFKNDTKYFINAFDSRTRKTFNADGTDPGMWEQIEMNDDGRLNTWAIFWAATIFDHHGLSCTPTKSLVRNIGFDGTGDHCGENPMEEIVDSIDGEITLFPDQVNCPSEVEYKEFKRFMRKKNKPYKHALRMKMEDMLKRIGLYNFLYELAKK
jgi:hypothetical protein